MKTKQQIKEDLWCDAELESDEWQSTMGYDEFMLNLDKYENALKNMESSSRIIQESDSERMLEAITRYIYRDHKELTDKDVRRTVKNFLASNCY